MFIRVAAILSVIAITVVYTFWQKKSLELQLVPSSKSEAVLAKLPASSFETLDGKPFVLHDLYQDGSLKLLVVHYWGTWCAPCEAELPELLKFIDTFKDKPGVKFLLVAVNDDLMKVQKHLKTKLIPKDTPIVWLMDNNNVHKEIFGTIRVPETFVFSSDKMTLKKYVGPQEWNKTMFFQTFDELLQISTHKL
jgi:cytochrome c biogenesis protein CcmG/thiol:disulfide interchange protein DsbE